jgi:uncharacterized membrane protein YcaP (DUF421 family)
MLEEMNPLGVALRVTLMYLYALALVRIAGKQTLGQLTGMDFVVTLVIGDLFDDVFWAEVPLAQGLVAFATIVLAHVLLTFATSRSLRLYRITTSSERLLVRNGRLVQEHLARERMRAEDVQSDLRTNGEEHLREVEEAWLEPSGQVSVIKKASNKPLPKKDQRLLDGIR